MRDNEKVSQLLKYVENGELVLPDFQRSFVWNSEDTRELLVSLIGDYFIGSMLVIEGVGKTESDFALNLIEGVKEKNRKAEISSFVHIVLDGQQRISSLYYALNEPNFNLKNSRHPTKFYFDVDKYIDGDINGSVIAVNINNKSKLNAIENKSRIIPFSKMKNDDAYIVDLFKMDSNFNTITNIVKDFNNREINIVKLNKDTPMEKILEIYERINRTGKQLSIFELMIAKMYKYGINLKNLLEKAERKYEFLSSKHIKPEMILKVMALISIGECKKKNIFELDNENFELYWNEALDSLDEAYCRITDLKNGYGVFNYNKWMPNTTVIVPLAAMLNFIKKHKFEKIINYAKIDKWYWCTVVNCRYDQGADSNSSSDYRAIKEWIKYNKVPEFLKKMDYKNEIDKCDNGNSALYKSIMNLIVLKGALDFQTGNAPQFNFNNIQQDHIFPSSRYKENSILNKTIISSSNQKKGYLKPSDYFSELIKEMGEEYMAKILKTHFISEKGLKCLLNDDLEGFMTYRKGDILKEIDRLLEYKKATEV